MSTYSEHFHLAFEATVRRAGKTRIFWMFVRSVAPLREAHCDPATLLRS